MEDKTDLFQLNSKRNKAFLNFKELKIQNFFKALNNSERRVNLKNGVDNVIDGIFEVFFKKKDNKNFVEIINTASG